MKKALLLLCFIVMALVTQAQMFSMVQGATNNIFPFGSNTSNKVQWMYLPSNFIVAPPAGVITKVYFKTWNILPTFAATYSNFSIRMLNTSLTSFPGAVPTAFATGAITAFTGNPVVVPSTGPFTWFSFTLTTPFPYTGQNLIVEIEQNNMVGQIYANCTNAAGNQRLWGSYGALISTGAPDNNIGDFGFDMLLSCDSPINIETVPTRFTADITWDPRPGASQYEYLIDQSPLNPPSSGYNFTTTPAISLKNLPDGTCYYIHVRTICGSLTSPWSLDSFCTIADCKVPEVTIDNVLSTSAIASWAAVPGATGYIYSVGTTPDTPTTGNKTTYTSVKLQGLWPNKPLYFYVRALCSPTPQSEWGVTPFHTMAYTGIQDVNNEAISLEAFPNPVKDMMQLKISGARGKNAFVMMTDMIGRVVYKQAIDAAELHVNMSGLPAGTYYIKYGDDNHNQLIKVTHQ